MKLDPLIRLRVWRRWRRCWQPASAVVYAAKGSDVHTVMVAGR